MESMGKKKPCPRRSFTPEFKTEIVELCRRGDRLVGQIAKDFDPTETAVHDRAKQAEVDAGQRDGLTSSEREELAALRRENRRLREDVDILKAGHLGFDRSRQRSRLVCGIPGTYVDGC
ncbi:transposase [Streptomyces europaeiscabiei]|uniref:transposase n=1 Tax=Streptomyces europaeiscabiei TaxID=146819 RepID=UPI0029C077C5|nr:transposase [Streptomyces europaeiscabiei]